MSSHEEVRSPPQKWPNSIFKCFKNRDDVNAAVVTAIHVADGQVVRKGDLLIDLDATNATSDASQAESALVSARDEAARGRALLDAIDNDQKPVLLLSSLRDQADLAEQNHILAGEYADYTSTVAEMGADIAQASATLRETAAARHCPKAMACHRVTIEAHVSQCGIDSVLTHRTTNAAHSWEQVFSAAR